MEQKKDLITPTVHLNGSGKTNLLNDYEEASTALYRATEMVAQTAPNMRDYYILQNVVLLLRLAEDLRAARLETLRSMRAEFEQLMEAVQADPRRF